MATWWKNKRQLAVGGWLPRALVAFFIAGGCEGSSTIEHRPTDSGGTSGIGGGAGAANASRGGTGGRGGTTTGATGGGGAGAGAEGGLGGADPGGAGGDGNAGAGAEPGVLCEPSVVLPDDTCPYPESLGGGDDPAACGVTPGAWYPIGDSDLGVWPELVAEDTPGYIGGDYMGSLVLDSDDQPILAMGCAVYSWTGGVWGMRAGLPAAARSCRLAIDADDRLYVAYYERVTEYQHDLHVRRWNGTAWEALGDVIASGEERIVAGLAFDADRTPYAFWSASDVDCKQYGVHRWDEAAEEWQSLHPDRRYLVNLCYATEAWFTLGPEGPAVGGYSDSNGKAVLFVLDGAEWTDVMGAPLSQEVGERAFDTWLTRDTSGALVVGWPTDETVRLFRRPGRRWEEIPPNEDTLSALPPASRFSAETYDSVVANERDIRLRRFEHCRWRGISASDRDGGISNSLGRPSGPVFAVGRTRVCVAWNELHLGSYVGVLRCHDLPTM